MDINEAKVVRYQNENGTPTLVYYYEIAGDSTETKPTANVADGSIFTETDTGDVYIYNAKGAEWNKMFGLSGGGAGQNKKSVITGTLATFADDFAEFFGITSRSEAAVLEAKFKVGDYHAILMIDASVLGVGEGHFAFRPNYDPDDLPYGIWYCYEFIFDNSNGVISTGASLEYNYDSDEPLMCWTYQNGDGTNPTDIMPYAANIPYELTVYYHPMS